MQVSDHAFARERLSTDAPQGLRGRLPQYEYEGFRSSLEKIPQLIHRSVDRESLEKHPGLPGICRCPNLVLTRSSGRCLGYPSHNEPPRSTHSFGARELRATTGGQLAPTSFKVQS